MPWSALISGCVQTLPTSDHGCPGMSASDPDSGVRMGCERKSGGAKGVPKRSARTPSGGGLPAKCSPTQGDGTEPDLPPRAVRHHGTDVASCASGGRRAGSRWATGSDVEGPGGDDGGELG